MSKIRAIFEYEFRCETNASETARKINSVHCVAQYRFGLRNFVLAILALKMNHVEDSNPK